MSCRVDSTGAIEDELNNQAVQSPSVLNSVAELKYDIVPAHVSASSGSQEFTGSSLHEGMYYRGTVGLLNQGEQPIKQAAASCKLGFYEFNEYMHAMDIASGQTRTKIIYTKLP